jgi:hypothetical protein
MDFPECESHELGTSVDENLLLSNNHEKPLLIPINQPHWWDDMVVHSEFIFYIP